MAIDLKELKTVLATIIGNLTGLQIIWSNQNAVTPKGDYIALRITTLRMTPSTDYISAPNDDEECATQGDREFVLSLLCTSENSVEILTELVNKLNLSKNSDILFENKLVYVTIESDPVDITVQIGNSFESRANMELLFRISKNFSSNTLDIVPVVRSIGINGNIDNYEINTIIQ